MTGLLVVGLVQCAFCEKEAEWKVFLAVGKQPPKAGRSFRFQRPDGRIHYLSRDRTTFRKLEDSMVVRIPLFFKEEGTPVCESCSHRDDVIGYREPEGG
ncbi:MAG: hypothetical protein ACE5LS_04750 [Thermoplasmata archaeon]